MQWPRCLRSRPIRILPAALLWAAGCIARPGADVRVGSPGGEGAAPATGQAVHYDEATFQLARDNRVQIVLFRTLGPSPAKGGAAGPGPDGRPAGSFEYVFLDLPERAQYGWVRQDRIDGWRGIRESGPGGQAVDRIWHADAGQARMRLSPDKSALSLGFRLTLEPVAGGGAEVALEGNTDLREDPMRTQGLMNTYGHRLRDMLRRTDGN